ncbi:hypothetical protein AAY77_08055, partial [Providencia rettgeri]
MLISPILHQKKKNFTPIVEKQKSVLPVSRTKLEDIKTIDSFVRRIKEENIYFISGNKKRGLFIK